MYFAPPKIAEMTILGVLANLDHFGILGILSDFRENGCFTRFRTCTVRADDHFDHLIQNDDFGHLGHFGDFWRLERIHQENGPKSPLLTQESDPPS